MTVALLYAEAQTPALPRAMTAWRKRGMVVVPSHSWHDDATGQLPVPGSLARPSLQAL